MAVQIKVDWESLEQELLESIPEGERRLVMAYTGLFSVEYVEVVNSHRPHGVCSIFGEISFSTHPSGPFVPLFKRSHDDPDDIDLGNPNFHFLTLSDDFVKAPPFLFYGPPIYMMVKLFEKKQDESQSVDDGDQSSCSQNPKEVKPKSVDDADQSSSSSQNRKDDDSSTLEEGVTCIANIQCTREDFFHFNKRCILDFVGESDFVFSMAYAILTDCMLVGVRFTFTETLETLLESQGDSSTKRKRPIDIYGVIEAVQKMGSSPTPKIQLFYRSSADPEQVSIGSPIHLDRTFVVAPVLEGDLYIGYELFSADNDIVIAKGIIPFPFPIAHDMWFVTDKNLSHTRRSKDGLVSITLQFMSDAEAADPSDTSKGFKPIPDYDTLK